MRFDKEAELIEEPTSPWRRRARLIAGGLLLVAGIATAEFWHVGQTRLAAAERRASLAALETALQSATTEAAAPDLAPEEQVRRLETLVRLRQQKAALQPATLATESAELRELEQRIELLRAQAQRRRSDACEQTARQRLAAGDLEGGAALLREAARWQASVNAGGADQVRDLDRELRLEREADELTAEPLAKKLAATTAEARAALAAANWDRALALFREARAMQEHLNHEFSRTRFSDLAAIGRIDAEIAALTADGLAASVDARLAEARELEKEGRGEDAVKELLAAATAQRTLNERFGQSRFVSMERLEAIESDRQTLLAAEPLRALQAQADAVRGFLRRRQIFQAQQRLRAALDALEDLQARFPKARQRDDELRAALMFLGRRAVDLAGLQDRLYEQLAPLGADARAMLRTEVLQTEFAAVMNTNPSRSPGAASPVDSVTYPEAEEFCRRLSWVLGWRVRLPTTDEMRAAQAMTAGGATDDPAAIRNLTGGLAEWIASAGGRENPNASVWSGAGEIAIAPRGERARTRGFRVVVEVDLARLDAVE